MSTTIETTGTIDSLTDAIEKALDRRGRWMLPAVVIHFRDNGELDAVPQPFLTDISWSERSREFCIVAELDRSTLDELAEYPAEALSDYAQQLWADHHCDEA